MNCRIQTRRTACLPVAAIQYRVYSATTSVLCKPGIHETRHHYSAARRFSSGPSNGNTRSQPGEGRIKRACILVSWSVVCLGVGEGQSSSTRIAEANVACYRIGNRLRSGIRCGSDDQSLDSARDILSSVHQSLTGALILARDKKHSRSRKKSRGRAAWLKTQDRV